MTGGEVGFDFFGGDSNSSSSDSSSGTFNGREVLSKVTLDELGSGGSWSTTFLGTDLAFIADTLVGGRPRPRFGGGASSGVAVLVSGSATLLGLTLALV